MRILILSDRYPPFYEGGYELQCRETVEGLRKRGHEVFILTTKYGIDAPDRNRNVFRLLECCGTKGLEGINTGYTLTQFKRAFMFRKNYHITHKIIREIAPDLAYVWQIWDASVITLFALRKEKIPYVFDIADYSLLLSREYHELKCGRLRSLARALLTGVDDINKLDFSYVRFPSNAINAKYSASGFRSQNATVIPYTAKVCSTARIAPERNERCEQIRLVYAGRLVEEKGVHIAIESVLYLIQVLKYTNISFDIIGTGQQHYMKKLKDRVHTAGEEKAIRFLGKLEREDLMEMFGLYDIFIFPSLWDEPFGMTLIEAMASGIAVIASRVGAVPEIITDGENGLIVPSNDALKLANGIKSLIDSPQLRKKICSKAVETVRKKYTHEEIIGQIERYLHTVIAKDA